MPFFLFLAFFLSLRGKILSVHSCIYFSRNVRKRIAHRVSFGFSLAAYNKSKDDFEVSSYIPKSIFIQNWWMVLSVMGRMAVWPGLGWGWRDQPVHAHSLPSRHSLACMDRWKHTWLGLHHCEVPSHSQVIRNNTAMQVSYRYIQSEINWSWLRGTQGFSPHTVTESEVAEESLLGLSKNFLVSGLQGQFKHTHSCMSIFPRHPCLSFAGSTGKRSALPRGRLDRSDARQDVTRGTGKRSSQAPVRGSVDSAALSCGSGGGSGQPRLSAPCCAFAALVAVGHLSGLALSCCHTLFMFVLVLPCISSNWSDFFLGKDKQSCVYVSNEVL